MAMNTKEREKKDKKKEKKQDGFIPEGLQDVPTPKEEQQKEQEEKDTIAPPRPIAMQEPKGDVPRPTRLPPRFKERFKKQEQKESVQVETQETKQAETKQEEQQSTGIRPPVKIRQRKDSIPAPSSEQPVRVKPTRIELDEPTQISGQQGRTTSVLATLDDDPLLKQFNVDELLQRPKEETWPWKTSRKVKITSEMESYWKIEGSLYAAIATLHFFTIAYEKGDVAPEVYSKQLKSHLLEAIQLRFKLEKDKKFDWEEFVKENKLDELFAEGIEKLNRVTGSSDIDDALDEETIRIDYQEMKKLPTKAADYVGNAIELMDLIRLQSVATVERLIPLLEDMKKIITTANIFEIDYWALKEMDMWIEKLYRMPPGSIPPEDELERFEMYVVRWMNDFRRELKNI